MKPLSSHDSQKLFYKRIFSHKRGPSEYEQLTKDILKKCGGVPLAIISIASILASDQHVKPKEEWHVLLQSIGRGLTEDASLEEMQRILSFSFYDLPSHLKTCLIYLSIYPEDHMIEREQLIWKWVAESFVCCGKTGTSLFQVGLTYFNELINRGMIQPIYDDIGQVKGCRVHDMMLDLIYSLSSEVNFVTMLDGTEGSSKSSQRIARRMSLRNSNDDHETTTLIDSISVSQVRSITIFPPAYNAMPALSRFDVLRVLDLSKCRLGKRCHLHLWGVGYLLHLRYLGLAGTGICEIPMEIGNLQFLQVLDIGGNDGMEELPSTVCKLRSLIFLHVDNKHPKRFLDGFGDLTSLEVLKEISASVKNVKELGNLPRLRELEIKFDDEGVELEEAFVESVCHLKSIQHLVLRGDFGSLDLLGKRWVPPRHLSIFESYQVTGGYDAPFPAWIKRDSSHLSSLSELRITVKEVNQEDILILGRLPALRRLSVYCSDQTQKRVLIGAGGFCRMIDFCLICGSSAQIVFDQGALPRAEQVDFDFGVRGAKEDGNGGFDFGLQAGNLRSLRKIVVRVIGYEATVGETKEAVAAVRRALHGHPNHPRIYIDMLPEIIQGAHDDDFQFFVNEKRNESAGTYAHIPT